MRFSILLVLFFLSFSFFARAQMRITEYMYSGANGEFVEFTNVGSTAIDMTGWSYADNGRVVGAVSLSLFGTVQPGESVILTETVAATFRTAWGLCNSIKIIGGNTTANLGRADEINLYDASNALVDRLTYDDVNLGGVRTQNKSGWVSAAGLGANNPTLWTLSTAGDAESSVAAGADIGSPGKSTRATVVYDPCAVSSTAPTIIINVATTTNYLDGGANTSPVSPFAVSGVKGDAGDPASALGINFTIGDDATPVGSLMVSVQSSNQTVVPLSNLVLTGSGADRNLRIIPDAVGYSNITVTVNDGANNTSYVIAYAVSQSPAVTWTNYWHTGIADASAAIALDDDYMIIGNDETNLLYVYDRKHSGLPVATFDFNQNNILSLTDGAPNYKEVDVEAGVKSIATAGKIYWLGSMSNKSTSSYDNKPNRNRLFAVTVSGTSAATSFANAGYYGNLRQQLINWGDANGYNFTAAAANFKDPKTIDGFNVEGMVFGPDNSTLYIGFRAPLVPTANRTKAVIAPIQNFETWFNNGAPAGNPVIGAPIELDLGGRGIRDIIRLSSGNYIIIAGSYDETATGMVYLWSGNAVDAPVQVPTLDISTLNAEGVLQINVNGTLMADRLQVISDNGDNAFYGDAILAKNLAQDNFRKYSSDVIISTAGSVLPVTFEGFTANKQGKTVLLNWKNAESDQVERFEILRSVNGSDFTAIGFVAGSASQTSYSFTDNTIPGTNKLYYRIRAIEHSGITTLTAVRFVDFGSLLPLITIYPNPVANNRFSLVVNQAGSKTVTVFGSNGALFRQLTFNDAVIDISTNGWPTGWYLLNIKTADGSSVTYKLIVP